jgi:hypothetical protein
MKGLLVRIGIDQAYGGWNAPVNPETREFAFVPIPGRPQRSGLETPYTDFRSELEPFPGFVLPPSLVGKPMHLDPDFQYLTYGDTGDRRGRSLAELRAGDFIAFYSGLRPAVKWQDPLFYALVGLYRVRECVRLPDITPRRWHENAHTRRAAHRPTDLVVRAEPTTSGRLERCLPIGEWRDRAYRVRKDLLEQWGGLSCRDGYIQRSVVPPRLLQPERFLSWFAQQKPRLVAANNLAALPRPLPRTLVYKRTHDGDPDRAGRFGAYDCMGSVRTRRFEAVIGVGGVGAEPRRHGIAEKVNWIGIGPHKTGKGRRGPVLTFDRFKWFGREGPRLAVVAPALAAHLYGRNVRSLMSFSDVEAAEVRSILDMARDAPRSPARPDPERPRDSAKTGRSCRQRG